MSHHPTQRSLFTLSKHRNCEKWHATRSGGFHLGVSVEGGWNAGILPAGGEAMHHDDSLPTCAMNALHKQGQT